MKVHPFFKGMAFAVLPLIAGLFLGIALCWVIYGAYLVAPGVFHFLGNLFPPNPWYS